MKKRKRACEKQRLALLTYVGVTTKSKFLAIGREAEERDDVKIAWLEKTLESGEQNRRTTSLPFQERNRSVEMRVTVCRPCFLPQMQNAAQTKMNPEKLAHLRIVQLRSFLKTSEHSLS